ncbi:MAG: hypothetical protein M1812_004709 [Candelaria pacifica]|nr:MAG: hypothetical protein M1812_004709 [Candelaria pacifica]
MFHRRRAASNPPTNTNVSAAATTAATQAFLAHRASNASLSNAAAAAALRSHTTSPVPVSNVQTKRIIRKQASNSSLGSGGGSVRSAGGRGLQRQNSSGSMTERTFRDPSPNRGGSNTFNDNPPPVPALPKNFVPPVPQKSSRRASSLEPPLRVSSPPPKKPNGRGVSLDRGSGSPPVSNPRQQRPKLNSVQEVQRTDSSGSINFSYPTNARNTPPTSPSEENRVVSPLDSVRPGSPLAAAPRPNSTLNNGEVSNIQNSVQDAANRPVKKKKKVTAKGAAEGSHLAGGGSSGGKPTGTAVNGDVRARTQARSPPPTQLEPTRVASLEPSAAASKPNTKKKVKAAPSPSPDETDLADHAVSYGSDVDSGAESTPDRPKNFNTRAAGMLAKQPSVVREDRELEEAAEYGGRPGALPQLQTGVAQGRKVATASSSKKNSENKQHLRSTSQPTPALAPTTSHPSSGAPAGSRLGTGPGKGSLRGERNQSLSPSRSTRFSTKPTVFDTLNAARHEPPPRSLSPAKSALKQSPSPRQRSPVDSQAAAMGRGYGKTPSEASDNTSLLSEEGALSGSRKKKQARVSFDEEAVVVGAAVSPPTSPDTPVVMSPQNQETTKRSWFSRGKKATKEQDDAMKPTPALPSFGSVRREEGISNRAQENELVESIPAPASSSARAIVDRINISNDSAVGSVLSQDFASKNSAGQQKTGEPGRSTSTFKQSDPLSQQVPSVEGTGYGSETDGSIYSTDDHRHRGASQGTSAIGLEDHAETYRALASPSPDADDESHQLRSIQQDNDVPSFNIIQATPNLQETESRQQWPGLPGNINRSANEDFDEDATEPPVVEHHPTDPTPASLGIAEPEPEEAAANHVAGSPVIGEMAEGLRLQTEPHDEDESDDTGNSIYSDAAEDLSDLEGDGFGSINAIVESPALKPSVAVTKQPDSPTSHVPKVETRPKSKLIRQESDIPEPSAEEGWDKAQEYWSKLSDRRKRQMELEAMSAEDEAVEPVQPKPKKKVVKKKATQPAAPTQQSTSDDAPLPPWPDQQYLSSAAKSRQSGAAGLKSSMRTESAAKPTSPEGFKQSMRAEPKSIAAEPMMKQSMRSDGNMRLGGRGQPAGSARQSNEVTELQSAPRPRQPQGAMQKKGRPASAAPVVDYSKVSTSATKHTRDFSGSSAASSTAPAPPKSTKKKITNPTPLKKTLSNGSDSSSSFRKSRRPASSGGFSMRSTMRGAPDPMPSREVRPSSPENTGNRSSRFSVRSLSPTGSTTRKPFSPPGAGAMRSSMRGSMDAPAPSLRKDSKDRAKSPSRFSFGGKQKAKAAPAVPKSGGFRSRFADSSDEDDYPTTFKSRYDSSDDDEPASPAPLNLAPVRGIPRKIGEADKESTDLLDSEEEPASPVTKKSNQTAALSSPVTVTHEGSALATGSLRRDDLNMAGGLKAKKAAEKEKEKKEKKRSFFGGRSKKKDEPIIPETPQVDSPTSPRQPANGSSVASPSSRGKLQRRNTPKSLALAQNEEWPLPPPIPGINGGRPSTADGAPSPAPNFRTSMRPDVGNRRSTTPAPPVEAKAVGKAATAPIIAGDTGKKKRFGGLRKVFGMK